MISAFSPHLVQARLSPSAFRPHLSVDKIQTKNSDIKVKKAKRAEEYSALVVLR